MNLAASSQELAAEMTRRYIITGRVQGVGFRWFVEREASAIGVGGWVRNNDNGNVEVLASGTDEQLAKLRARLKQGPRASRVDQVLESEEQELNEPSFRIEGAW
jgi:acylphosphatase